MARIICQYILLIILKKEIIPLLQNHQGSVQFQIISKRKACLYALTLNIASAPFVFDNLIIHLTSAYFNVFCVDRGADKNPAVPVAAGRSESNGIFNRNRFFGV